MLSAFTHEPSPAMSYGLDRVDALPDDVAALCGAHARVLIVTDPGVAATGIPDAAARRLSAAGVAVEQFDEVESDPSAVSIDAASRKAKVHKADLILGIGGGSALDVAKLAASVAVADAPAESYAVMANPLPARAIRRSRPVAATCMYGSPSCTWMKSALTTPLRCSEPCFTASWVLALMKQ